MRSIIRYRPAPALAVAGIAVLFAVGGVALASIPDRSGVIHACYQKSGGVLRVINTAKRGFAAHCGKCERALAFNQRGRQGLRGSQGPQGVPGSHGPKGDQGPAGPLTTTVPSGQTLRGWFNFDTVAASANQINGGSIPFGFAVATAPTVQIIPVAGPTTAQCAGSVANPTAAPGFLCVYESSLTNVSSFVLCSSAKCSSTTPTADPFGAEVFVNATAAGRFFVDGTWAVTSA